MASLGLLVTDLAQALGLSEPTVSTYAKTLREAGLIRTSGRGTSAARMEFDDGVNLLTAILSSPTIAESPDRTRHALELPFVGSMIVPFKQRKVGEDATAYAENDASPLNANPPYVFEDAISALLVSAAKHLGQEDKSYKSEYDKVPFFWTEEYLQITFGLPNPIAIVNTRIGGVETRRHIFGGSRTFNTDSGYGHFDLLDWEAKLSGQDFTQARRIGAKVILATAASLLKPLKTTRARR